MFLDETPPDTVNEEGTKWWIDKSTTQYARRKGLKAVLVLLAENQDGHRAFLIQDGREIVYKNQSLDAIGCRIDAMALANKL